jgi:hypothetical protein
MRYATFREAGRVCQSIDSRGVGGAGIRPFSQSEAVDHVGNLDLLYE